VLTSTLDDGPVWLLGGFTLRCSITNSFYQKMTEICLSSRESFSSPFPVFENLQKEVTTRMLESPYHTLEIQSWYGVKSNTSADCMMQYKSLVSTFLTLAFYSTDHNCHQYNDHTRISRGSGRMRDKCVCVCVCVSNMCVLTGELFNAQQKVHYEHGQRKCINKLA
jgi:hypothetical protein